MKKLTFICAFVLNLVLLKAQVEIGDSRDRYFKEYSKAVYSTEPILTVQTNDAVFVYKFENNIVIGVHYDFRNNSISQYYNLVNIFNKHATNTGNNTWIYVNRNRIKTKIVATEWPNKKSIRITIY